MNGTDTVELRVAELLAEAWRTGVACSTPSQLIPGLDRAAAYRIQTAVVAALSSELGPQVGWKVGLTSSTADEPPFHGPLHRRMLHASGAVVPLSPMIAPKIEVELGFVPHIDIEGERTRAELLEVSFDLVTLFEIIDTRTDLVGSDTDWIADLATMRRVVAGTPTAMSGEVDDLRGILREDRALVGDGVIRDVIRHPLASLAWLSGVLADHPRGIRAGDIILTGSLTGQHPIVPGLRYHGSVGDLPAVEVAFH